MEIGSKRAIPLRKTRNAWDESVKKTPQSEATWVKPDFIEVPFILRYRISNSSYGLILRLASVLSVFRYEQSMFSGVSHDEPPRYPPAIAPLSDTIHSQPLRNRQWAVLPVGCVRGGLLG